MSEDEAIVGKFNKHSRKYEKKAVLNSLLCEDDQLYIFAWLFFLQILVDHWF